MTQFVPIIQGFKEIVFECGTVPTDRMLLEMIKPGADHEVMKLKPVKITEWGCIDNLGSQFLFQIYSNKFVDEWLEAIQLKEVCEFHGFGFDEFSYHDAVICYIQRFFAPNPNWTNARTSARQLKGIISKNDRGRSDEALSDWKESKILSKSKNPKYLEFMKLIETKQENNGTQIKRKSQQNFIEAQLKELQGLRESIEPEYERKLLKKFSSYQKADDFMIAISENQKVNTAILDYAQKLIESAFNERQSGYRSATKVQAGKAKRLLQCQYCNSWYEVPMGGKLRIKCESCFKEWDRLRRRKPKSVIPK